MAALPAHTRHHRWHRAAVATAFMVSAWLLALAWRPLFTPVGADETAYSRAWARTTPKLAEASDCLACHARHGRGFVHAGSNLL
jgi:mono/diheme cytochrome c family protein